MNNKVDPNFRPVLIVAITSFVVAVVALVVVLGLVFMRRDSVPPEPSLPRVTYPQPNQMVESPLQVVGSAPGGWFFEASLPIELLDGNGQRLAIVPAQAIGEWMTPQHVAFETTLTFPLPVTSTGTLVVAKDNPSGLPENDQRFLVPIKFSQSSSTTP